MLEGRRHQSSISPEGFEVKSLKLPFINAPSPSPAKCHNQSTLPTVLISKHHGPVLCRGLKSNKKTKWLLNNSNNLSLHVNLALRGTDSQDPEMTRQEISKFCIELIRQKLKNSTDLVDVLRIRRFSPGRHQNFFLMFSCLCSRDAKS